MMIRLEKRSASRISNGRFGGPESDMMGRSTVLGIYGSDPDGKSILLHGTP
jgi:hypothetical protein